MRCANCDGTEDLRELEILPLPEEQDTRIEFLCVECLAEKMLLCEKHGVVHTCISEDVEQPGVRSACHVCARETVEEMDPEVVLEYAKLLREHFGDADVEEVCILGDVDEMSKDELLVFGALMLSGFYDQTLEELISDITADRGGATLQ